MEKNDCKSDIEASLKASKIRRGPSALRFRCLISDTTDVYDDSVTIIEGDYFKVTSKTINGSVDVVFISPSGNIACTTSSYARWGFPSKHILAVFYHGRICLNMRQHCKTKYKMSPSSVRSEGGEAAAGYCLNSVSYRVDEAVKYNVLNSD